MCHPFGSGTLQTWPRIISINDQQRDRGIHDGPCAFHESIVALNLKHRTLFPLPAILSSSEIRSPVFPIPCSISFTTNFFTRSHNIVFPWPSHMLASSLIQRYRVGPRASSVNRIGKSRSWCMRLNISLWLPDVHLYGHPVTVWRLMQSKQPPRQWLKHDLTV